MGNGGNKNTHWTNAADQRVLNKEASEEGAAFQILFPRRSSAVSLAALSRSLFPLHKTVAH